MKTLLRMAAMGIVGVLIGLIANALSPEPLPLRAPAEQFEVEVDEGIQVHSAEIMDLWESGEALFVDSRGADAYAEGRIPGAFSVSYKTFEEGETPETVDYLPRDRLLVIYCDGADCHASQVVRDKLLELGFEERFMKIFHGGWNEWIKAGGAIETDEG